MADNANLTKIRLQKEVECLNNIKSLLIKAKQELNNDLTKLAIRNLPIMIEDSAVADESDQRDTSEVNLSQSTTSSQQDNQTETNIHHLEPLDLDID